MSMSPDVQAEYDRILIAITLREGTLMAPPGDRQYGWIASDHAHLHTCDITTYNPTPIETSFSQFEGTFEDGIKIRHAIDVSGVSCRCGSLVNREVRWEPYEGVGEVAEKVFEQLYREMKR